MKIQTDLPFASDDECIQRRACLIAAGIINPLSVPVCGKLESRPVLDSLPSKPRRVNIHEIPEEGTYKVRRIAGDAEYERRKRNYFVVLQSILRSRDELDVEFEDEV